jgi:hypothetical protein
VRARAEAMAGGRPRTSLEMVSDEPNGTSTLIERPFRADDA